MEAKSRSLEDIKNDIARRAGRINPFERVDRKEVEGLLGRLTSLDPDLWGREWGKLGARHEANAQELENLRQERGGRSLLPGLRVLSHRSLSCTQQCGKNELL